MRTEEALLNELLQVDCFADIAMAPPPLSTTRDSDGHFTCCLCSANIANIITMPPNSDPAQELRIPKALPPR